MAVSYTDMDALRQDAVFISRVRAAIIKGSIAIGNEDPRAVVNHTARVRYTSQVMNNPDAFKQLFTDAVAADSNVINPATSNGTVAITGANAATRAALVSDANIDSALGVVFNAFFVPS